ncbi:MAG TPA: DUF4197 domain-containing protein, partial [Spirochaetes bacterium]|nr:DUF4197 domain-containing protein [Spirochaetota bacterium]
AMKSRTIMLVMVLMFSCGFIGPITPAGAAGWLDKAKKAAEGVTGKSDGKLDSQTIVEGLKDALAVGTRKAVDKVSQANGYYKNPRIKIPLPAEFERIAKALRKVGLGKEVDKFELKMNQAAEKAAPRAVAIFLDAVKKMTISDARRILYSGGDTEATIYFEKHTRPALFKAFFPVVKDALDQVGATKLYKKLLAKYNSLPLVEKKEYNIDTYVTNKALDGLFVMVGDEEKQIRRNPAARTTQLLKKVFGSR